jgi:hypothetical protein
MAAIWLSICSTYYIYRSIGRNHGIAISKAAEPSRTVTCTALPLVHQVPGRSRVAAANIGNAPQEPYLHEADDTAQRHILLLSTPFSVSLYPRCGVLHECKALLKTMYLAYINENEQVASIFKICILEGPGSILDRDTDCVHRWFSHFPSIYPGKCRYSISI